MDLDLARIYGTPGQKVASAAQEEQLEAQAQAELFAKLAGDNGIDLTQYSDEEISGLWAETFGEKLAADAEDKPKEEPKEEAKKEEAKEDEEKKAAAELAALQDEQQKLAFADQAGRIMAHAMVSELNSINEAIAKEAAASAKTAGATAGAARSLQKKEASALDKLAIEAALTKAAAAGFDVEEATSRIAAVATLGLAESEKIASAPAGDLDAAVDIRSLEYLEAAGYPVEWA